MTHSAKREALMEIANLIVQNSGGRASLAFQEEDKTTEQARDAAHFIKVDGERICRDIEMYGFMGDGLLGWEMTLAMFLEEVLLTTKASGLTESYRVAAEKLKEIGHEVYSADKHAKWDGIF